MSRALSLLALALAVPLSGARPEGKAPAPPKLSGPFTHENLTVFLIHGPDQLKGPPLLTLDEALEQKKVVVHETKTVNELSVENVGDAPVFLQACDIVKGGQQDRILAHDLLLPPKSGKVAIKSFCCEQGRWSKRGAEDEKAFGSSKGYACTTDLRYAARVAASQQEVWKNVDKAQMDIGKNVGADVKGAQSPSSLQLTMEHKKLLEAVDAMVKKLSGALDGKDDVVGLVVCVNGKVLAADVYAQASLCKKLWPKLLRSAAMEAVALKDKPRGAEVKAEDVQTFLASAEKGKNVERQVGKALREVRTENDKQALFETFEGGACLRRSYLAK
jgi:hypothetical protein